jgi:hypothetical protein
VQDNRQRNQAAQQRILQLARFRWESFLFHAVIV